MTQTAQNKKYAAELDQLLPHFFPHQLNWHKAKKHKIRHITASRQIGCDYYFAFEALQNAIATGEDQIFLGGTIAQAQIAFPYIFGFVYKAQLEGLLEGFNITCHHPQHLVLPNGAKISFLSPKCRLSSFHGNIYVPNYAWSDNPRNMIAAASSLSMYKGNSRTFYTSVSDQKGAYEAYQRILAHRDVWTDKVDLYQAQNGDSGMLSALSIEEIKHSFTPDQFNMLMMCQWPQESAE